MEDAMMTAKVIPFFRDVSFDPDTTHIMGQAFDGACKELHDIAQSDLVKSVIAKRIIEVAKTGERDPNRLCDRALQAFGLRLSESKAAGRSALLPKRLRGFGLAPSPFSGRI
jgi:hypothetical protein